MMRPLTARPTAEELGAVQNKNKSNDFKSAVSDGTRDGARISQRIKIASGVPPGFDGSEAMSS
jgi:hypothetical protein